MELWDAYFKDGTPAHIDLVRGEPIPAGIYHLVSEVLVRHVDGDYLLMQRDPQKPNYGGYFEATAGGSALKGEDALLCAKRELQEETGITAGVFERIGTYISKDTIYEQYLCVTDQDKWTVTLQDGETVAYRWVTEAEFAAFVHSGAMIPVQKLRYMDFLREKGYLRGAFADVQWLFFDIGSTLANEEAVYAHLIQALGQQVGRPANEISAMMLDSYQKNQNGYQETLKALGAEKPKWRPDLEALYEDAHPVLEALHKKYHIGVIANQVPGCKARLENWGILPYIDLVVSSGEEGVSKPDPAIFQIALSHSKCSPQNAVMIGDRIDNDIRPAKALGMRTIWIRQGYGQYWTIREEAEMPDAIVNDLSQLREILLCVITRRGGSMETFF